MLLVVLFALIAACQVQSKDYEATPQIKADYTFPLLYLLNSEDILTVHLQSISSQGQEWIIDEKSSQLQVQLVGTSGEDSNGNSKQVDYKIQCSTNECSGQTSVIFVYLKPQLYSVYKNQGISGYINEDDFKPRILEIEINYS